MALLTLVALVTWGCDDRPQEPPRPPRPVRSAPRTITELVGIDAGSELPLPDPPTKPGSLAEEVAHFNTLDACVERHAEMAPLLADAISALGYTGFVRDSCRVLEAAKTRSTEPCNAILSTTLQAHCRTTVAATSGSPNACPMKGGEHDAFCTAIAYRDPRLCATVDDEHKRSCSALIADDESVCKGDVLCARLVKRWKGLLQKRQPGPPIGSKIEVSSQETTTDGGTEQRFDLSNVTAPARIHVQADTRHLTVGEASSRAWPPALLAPAPRLSVHITGPQETFRQGRRTLRRDQVEFALLLPKVGLFRDDDLDGLAEVVVDVLKSEVGEPVRFDLRAQVRQGDRSWSIQVHVNTYLRDLVRTDLRSP